MGIDNPVSPELLNLLLSCDYNAGSLTWKSRSVGMFGGGKYSAERSCAAWNAKNAGKLAFTADLGCGYNVGRIFGINYRAHRVIYAMHYGEWPEAEIDHIDGDPSNNSIANLRPVTGKDNRRNMKRYRTNTSGYVGVSWDKKQARWEARISSDKGVVRLGYFSEKDQAIKARSDAEIALGYHGNHGRFTLLAAPVAA